MLLIFITYDTVQNNSMPLPSLPRYGRIHKIIVQWEVVPVHDAMLIQQLSASLIFIHELFRSHKSITVIDAFNYNIYFPFLFLFPFCWCLMLVFTSSLPPTCGGTKKALLFMFIDLGQSHRIFQMTWHRFNGEETHNQLIREPQGPTIHGFAL